MNKDLTNNIISGSILKFLKHDEFTKNLRTPITCQIILTNSCNLKCYFCGNKHRKTKGWENNQAPVEKIKNLIDDLKDLGVKGIEFTGGGEPLLYPHFEKVAQYALNKGIKIALVTNGTKLSEIPLSLLENMDWIRISINSSHSNYKKIHGVDCYDNVIKSLKYINGLKIPNKGVSYIFGIHSDLKDAQELLNDIQSFNLDYFRVSSDISKNIKINIGELESSQIPIVNSSDRCKRVSKTCGIFYYKPVINCDGNIYPCCIMTYIENNLIGRDFDIKSVINNKNIRVDTSKCPYCTLSQINDLIEAMNKPMKNIQFV